MKNKEEANHASYSLHIGTRLSPDIRNRALVVAREKDWTLSQLIRNALVEYIGKHGVKKHETAKQQQLSEASV